MSTASFESRDLNTDPFASRDLSEKNYMGPERRRQNRRSHADRRSSVRFDLAGDRRQAGGRREDDLQPKFW